MTTDPQRSDSIDQTEPAANSASPARRWPWLIVAVLVAALVLGGAAGLYLYDRATGVDRSDPSATVQQFLTAVFVEKDATRVRLFTCPDLAPETAIARAQGALDAEATASWDMVVVDRQDGNRAQVSVRLMTTYPGELAPSGQRQWTFQLVDASGWRVCSFEWDA